VTGSLALVIIIAALLGALVWLLMGARSNSGSPELENDETREAEDEVQDLDAFTSPDEAEEELPDWGPGAPKS
jgi:cytoskeletal protein RodZ